MDQLFLWDEPTSKSSCSVVADNSDRAPGTVAKESKAGLKCLSSGVTVSEQQQIFGLLKELSADREMQKWAQAVYKENSKVIEGWKADRDKKIQQKINLCVRQIQSPSDKAEILGLDLGIREIGQGTHLPT